MGFFSIHEGFKIIIVVWNEEEFCRRVSKSEVDLVESFRSECLHVYKSMIWVTVCNS